MRPILVLFGMLAAVATVGACSKDQERPSVEARVARACQVDEASLTRDEVLRGTTLDEVARGWPADGGGNRPVDAYYFDITGEGNARRAWATVPIPDEGISTVVSCYDDQHRLYAMDTGPVEPPRPSDCEIELPPPAVSADCD